MKLAEYLADYIEHEKHSFCCASETGDDIIVEMNVSDLQNIIQAGIEVFVESEDMQVIVIVRTVDPIINRIREYYG
jgi:hypothetical protein